MSIRVVFLEDGEPLQHLRIRTNDGVEMATDDQGQLELNLQAGKNELLVHHEGSWVPQTISVHETASMVLVDVKENIRESKAKINPKTSAKISFSDVGRMDLGDRYTYDRIIGRGGMSVVIRAKDRLLKRDVAIKLLSDELYESDEAQDIFLTEARNLATLEHPNLVSIHDITKIENRAMMVMEYIRGETLERLMKKFRKGFPEHVGLRIAIQFAKVLGYLHDEGIVHRDIKLANAMVRHDGTLKLIDFGLARRFDSLYIRGTRVRGTPAYMSPEQIRGEALTPASDIYQMGVCLFELFTGRLPFEEGEMSYAHVHEEPPNPLDINPKLNPTLGSLILYCLKKSPHERPLTAYVVLKQLQNLHNQTTNDGEATDNFFASTVSSLTQQSIPAITGAHGLYETNNHISQSGVVRYPTHPSHLNHPSHPSLPQHQTYNSQLELNTGEQQVLHPSSPGLYPQHPTLNPPPSKTNWLGIGVGIVGICCMVVALVMFMGKNNQTMQPVQPVQPKAAKTVDQPKTTTPTKVLPGAATTGTPTKPKVAPEQPKADPTPEAKTPENAQKQPAEVTEPPKTDTPKQETKPTKRTKKAPKVAKKTTKKTTQKTATKTTPKTTESKPTQPATKTKKGDSVLFGGDEPVKKNKSDGGLLPMQ